MILHITHIDLDGAGSEVIIRGAFRGNELKTKRVNYDKIDDAVLKAISKNPNKLIITDILPNDDGEAVDALCAFKGYLMIFDHHKTAMPLAKKIASARNCTLITDINGTQPQIEDNVVALVDGYSATYISSWYLREPLPMVEHVNKFDMTGTSDGIAGELNSLFYEIGISKSIEVLQRNPLYFTDDEKEVLRSVNDRYETYFASKLNTLASERIDGYKICVIDATDSKTFIFNRLLKDYDYVTLLDRNKRTIGFRGNYGGCDEVAKKFNGGGHAQAAGSPGIHTNDEIFQAWREVIRNEV